MRGMNFGLVALLVVASCGRTDDARPPAKAPSAPTARPSLSGRAIDAGGRPLAGAVFSATPVPTRTIDPPMEAPTADAAGEFVFPKLADGDWDVRCSWDGAVDVLVATVRLPAVDRLDFRLPDGGVIAGTLVDAATKAPIAGATLQLRRARPIATAKTDAAGRFSVKTHRPSTGATWVEVESPGAVWRTILLGRYYYQCVVGDGWRQELALEATRAVELTGTVTGPDGPLADVEVHAWLEADVWFESLTRITERKTRTDAAGRYRFADVQDAAGWVVADAPGFVVASPDARDPRFSCGPDETIRSTSPEDGAAWVVDVEMKVAATCAVGGRVVDADGKPVAGATVGGGARVNRVETKSAADGTFAIPRAVAGADDVVRVAASSGTATAESNPSVEDGYANDLELVLKSLPRVHGVVKRESGAPVPGTIVTATDDGKVQEVPSPPDASAVAAADGSYSLELPDASCKFDIHAVEPGTSRTYVEQVDAAKAARDATLDVVLDDDATLVGRVVKKGTKEPVAGVFVAELSGRADRSEPHVLGYVDGRTDADGRFKIPHAGDACEIRVVGDGWLPFYKFGVDSSAGEFVVELSPALTIEGRVAFDDGSPAAGARVWITHGDGDEDCLVEAGDSAQATTDADGRFVLREIGAGPWTLGVCGDAAGLVARKVGGVAGGTKDLKIAVKRGTKIVGRVCGADDKPIADAHVFALAKDKSRPHPDVETVADGSFALTCLDDGEYVVRVEARDHLPAERTMRGNDAAAAFRLEEGLDVRGRLVDPDGKPGAKVSLRLESLPGESSRIGGYGWTDADGRFRIGGLVPGRYRLKISYAGTWRFEAPKEFVVEAGATDVVVKCVPKPE